MTLASFRGIRIIMKAGITAIMVPTMNEESLYHLLSWLSPAYPIGAFSHSHGLEWAVEAGLANDRPSVEAWIEDVLLAGSGWNDAVVFVHSYRAVLELDPARLLQVAELAAAAQPSYERRLETIAQGAAFRLVAAATAGPPAVQLLDPIDDQNLAYPVVVATVAASHAIPLTMALTAYLHAIVANIVSSALRLAPLGQTDGQRVLAAARFTVADLVRRAITLQGDDPFFDLAGSTLMSDLSSMLHETQYTRLFRT
jgi:urease accessory protein